MFNEPAVRADAVEPSPAHARATRRALLISACMLGSAALAYATRRRAQRGSTAQPPKLGENIPMAFAAWRMLSTPTQIVNPQTQQMLDALYSEVLTRTYFNDGRYHIMLSAAYGNDQRGGLEAHKPEVCYPAQGFVLHDQRDDVLATQYGAVPVRRLRTSLGARQEPITYWFAMADTVNATALDKRLSRLRAVLTGAIPDGILMRVSSIDPDASRGYRMHDRFIEDMLSAMPEATRERVLGRQAS